MIDIVDTLTDALRRLERKGDLNYVSIACIDGLFHGTYRGVGDRDFRQTTSICAAEALYEALTGRKLKPTKGEPAKRAQRSVLEKPAPIAPLEYEDLL